MTTQAEQAELDTFAQQIGGTTVWHTDVNGHLVADLLWWGPAGLRGEVLSSIAAAVVAAIPAPAPAKPFKLLRAKDDHNGAIYAVSTTSFKHILGDGTFQAGVNLGLWGDWDAVVELPLDEVAKIAAHLGGCIYDPNTAETPVVVNDDLNKVLAKVEALTAKVDILSTATSGTPANNTLVSDIAWIKATLTKFVEVQ